MAGESRIRISLATGELEIEGTDAFVGKYDAAVEAMIARLGDVPRAPLATSAPVGGKSAGEHAASVPTEEVRPFGEVLHALPNGASGSDQILVAGQFAAQGSSDGTFATNEANRLLIEQGVKLSNASQSLRNNLSAKRVFKVGNRFRVSRVGEQHIESLIGH